MFDCPNEWNKKQTIPKYTILTDRKGEYLLTEKMNLCLANGDEPYQ